jgi:hypothetical protein
MPEQEKPPYRGRSFDLEENQPDPMLQLSTRQMGGGGFSLIALAILAVLAIVFYGLNGRDTEKTASIPTPAPANSASPHG